MGHLLQDCGIDFERVRKYERDTGVFLEDLAIGIANNLVFLAVLAALAVVVVRAVRKKKPLGRLGKKKSKLPAGEEPKSEE